jgi:hypothetical protein
MTYRIVTNRLGHDVGAIVTADDLPGANIGALLAANHIAEVDTPTEADSEPKPRRKAQKTEQD